MKASYFKIIALLNLIILLLFTNHKAIAQFSYAGIRTSYNNVRFDKGDGLGEGTRINDLALNIDFLHRPLRNFAFGVSFRVPIINGFKFDYTLDNGGSETNVSGGGSFEDDEVPFAGGNFFYNIENTISYTLIGRIYFDTEANLFLDIRYSINKYDEVFSFQRNNDSQLPDREISHQESISTSGFGFSLGYNLRFTERFYLGYQFTVDFTGTDDNSFEANIETGTEFSTGNIISVPIRSKIDDSQTSYELSFNFGYIF